MGWRWVITGARYSWGFRPPQNIFWTVFRQSRSDVMFAASGTGRSISCLGNSPSGRWLQAVSPLTYDLCRVRFAHEEAGLPFCLRDLETGRLLATDRHLVDERNDTLIVRSAASCTYAEEPAPAGTGTVSGVLDYFNGNYMLRITNRLMEFP